MVAVGTIKLRRADTANGIPMEWPPPSTSVALGLFHPGDKLGQGEASFHITAHGVQNDQQAFDLRVLLNIHQLRDDVLILGGFLGIRGQGVALDGTDDSQAVDGVRPLVAGTVPLSVIRSCSSRWSAALSVGLSFGRDLVFFEVGSIASSPLSGLVCTERRADMRKKRSARYI